jgi:hypothetical protein
MPRLRISPEALALATSVIELESMTRPVLSVGWHKGQMQNSMGPNGEVIWTRTQDAAWYASLSDWSDMDEMEEPIRSGLQKMCEQISGLQVLVGPEVRAARGEFTVTVSDGKLELKHREA